MADDVWGRPRIPTGESVAAALRLAKELKPDASMLREGAAGSTELLVRDGGEVRRYAAYESGATELIETRRPARRFRLGRRLIYAGLLSVPLIVAAGFIFRPANSTLWIGGPFAIAMGLVFCGAIVQSDDELEVLVGKGAPSAATPYDLHGWEPRTVAQLAAVEELSKASDEHPRVRNIADGGVEVETFRKRERRGHLLDARGSLLETTVSAVPGGVYWTTKLAALCFVIPFAATIVFDRGDVFVIGMALYMIILVMAWRVDRRKHLVRPGEEWFDVQIEPPSD